jgi:hypothetical protein
MSAALRTTPLLVVGLALVGCSQDPAVSELGQSRPKADVSRSEASPNLPTVTLKVPGMT